MGTALTFIFALTFWKSYNSVRIFFCFLCLLVFGSVYIFKEHAFDIPAYVLYVAESGVGLEYLFKFIINALSFLGFSDRAVIGTIQCATVFGFVHLFYRTSGTPLYFSIVFCLISAAVTLGVLNGLRQSISCLTLIYGLFFLNRRNMSASALMFLISIFTHYSALLIIPMSLLICSFSQFLITKQMKFTVNILVFLAFGVFSTVFLDIALELSGYQHFKNVEHSKALTHRTNSVVRSLAVLIVFFSTTAAYAVSQNRKFCENEEINILNSLRAFFIGLILGLSFEHGEISSRLTYVYFCFELFWCALCFKNRIILAPFIAVLCYSIAPNVRNVMQF